MTSVEPRQWDTGRAVIDQMLDQRTLERIPANTDHAATLLDQATAHVASGEMLTSSDPVSAYSLIYEGARKAMTAVLAVQGLRPTQLGGHIAVREALSAQFPNPFEALGRTFNVMRRTRNQNDYPSAETVPVSTDEAEQAVTDARAIIDAARRLVPVLAAF